MKARQEDRVLSHVVHQPFGPGVDAVRQLQVADRLSADLALSDAKVGTSDEPSRQEVFNGLPLALVPVGPHHRPRRGQLTGCARSPVADPAQNPSRDHARELLVERRPRCFITIEVALPEAWAEPMRGAERDDSSLIDLRDPSRGYSSIGRQEHR